MTDPLAIQGNYADFKLVKTRSVCQLVIEIPIERAEQAIKAFGIPQPSTEIPVAVARLQPVSSQPKPSLASPSQRKPATTRAEKARRLCGIVAFQQFLLDAHPWNTVLFQKMDSYERASAQVKYLCSVDSKARLDTNEVAAKHWDALLASYEQATGRMAERTA